MHKLRTNYVFVALSPRLLYRYNILKSASVHYYFKQKDRTQGT